MTFKDLMQRDVKKTFLNLSEFGEEHMVDGKKMPVVVDSYELTEREKKESQHMDGIYKNQKLVYVAASDFGKLPAQGSKLTLDGKMYTVSDAVSEGGLYSITIEANKGKGR